MTQPGALVATSRPTRTFDSSELSMNAISLRNVTKRFDGTLAVDDLSLAVPTGSIYGFIGPNGSGKTTTLRMIMHILLPDQGEIEVLGSRDTAAARDRVSYLPEERGLYKKMTVRRLLRYYARLKGGTRAGIDAAIDEWMQRMELPGLLDRQIETLSKGMSQKVQFIVGGRVEPLPADPRRAVLRPRSGQRAGGQGRGPRRCAAAARPSSSARTTWPTAEKMCDRIFMIFRGRKVLDGTLDEHPGSVRRRHRAGPDLRRRRCACGHAGRRGGQRLRPAAGGAARTGIRRRFSRASPRVRRSITSRSRARRCRTSSSGSPSPE